MTRTHVIIPDSHANPEFNNRRFDYIGRYLLDTKPDVVINMGDLADMSSLSSYDKGKKEFKSRRYNEDIAAAVDAQDRMWHSLKKQKKRMPKRYQLVGNHEYRIARAINHDTVLEGTIGLKDLQFEYYNDVVVGYDGDTPGTVLINGVLYSHYFLTGLSSNSVGGENPASSILGKKFVSATQAHSHIWDFSIRTNGKGQKLCGLVAGVYQDWRAPFAGQSNDLWTSGITVCHNVDNGWYEVQFISLESLKREYGGR